MTPKQTTNAREDAELMDTGPQALASAQGDDQTCTRAEADQTVQVRQGEEEGCDLSTAVTVKKRRRGTEKVMTGKWSMGSRASDLAYKGDKLCKE